ncbi:MAG: toll/interleukin-1 receptor domain-containing protein, partial [Thauera sp.]
RRLLAAAAVLAALGLGGWWLWQGRGPGPEAVVGAWKAEVAYPWNLSLEETFDFALRDGSIEGQASFLGVARALEAVAWRDGRLHFLTRSETVSGNEPAREMVQRYEVAPVDDTLRVRLQIHRSHSVDAPLEFVAQRR